MKKPYEELREKIIGFGDFNPKKSYYPELQEKIQSLENEISSKIALQEDLKNKNTYLASILDSTYDFAIIATDMKGVITLFNKGAEIMLGYKAEEVIDRETPLLFHTEDEIELKKIELKKLNIPLDDDLIYFVYKLKDSLSSVQEWTYVDKNGKKIPVELSISKIIADDNQLGFLGIAKDITIKKDFEERIKRQNRHLNNVINTMPFSLILINSDLKLIRFNHSAYTEFPYIKNFQDKFPVFLNWIDDLNVKLKNALESDSTIISSSVKSNDGCFYNIKIFKVEYDPDEKNIVISLENVSDLVKIQEMVIRTEKIHGISRLAAGMAHEINNPLAGVLQNLQVLENRLSLKSKKDIDALSMLDIGQEELQKYLNGRSIFDLIENIRTASVKAADTVKTMLNFTRMKDNTKTQVFINDLIKNAITLCQTDIVLKKEHSFKEIEIVYDSKNNISIMCNFNSVAHVLYNMFKFIVENLSKKHSRKIEISYHYEQEYTIISFRHYSETMSGIFFSELLEPFHLKNDTDVSTNLELSTAYFIIKNHYNGDIKLIDEGENSFRYDLKFHN
ncbi:MAG: PAS domain S-box protein [Candidatus Delongbacteria bacterium]|nr:PAS domain S-box protein [Candidatus Delongbacteria bacterium]MBN2833649.1 PAS domain S-box protein [Candidatus Delongbacteria bacterium]